MTLFLEQFKAQKKKNNINHHHLWSLKYVLDIFHMLFYLIFRKKKGGTILILIKKTDHYNLKTKDNILNKLEKNVTPKVPILIKNSRWYLNFSAADSKCSLGHPSAPAPSILYPASNLDW